MICMFLVFIHLFCIAFGFDGFVKSVEALVLAGCLEIGVIDLPVILTTGTKKGVF